MQIKFEIETQHGTYRDALYFPDDAPLPDDATIEAMKEERVQNWIDFILNPPPPPVDENDNPIEG